MRTTKRAAWLSLFVSAIGLSCARGVDPDAEGAPQGDQEREPSVAGEDEDAGADGEDAGADEEDAGVHEMSGADELPEDEDRARDEPEPASEDEQSDGPDAGAADISQDDDAGTARGADAAVASTSDASTDEDASAQEATGDGSTEDAGTHATSTMPTSAGDEPQEPTPAREDEATAAPVPAEPEAENCRSISDCAMPCFPVGLLPCCRADGSCGCTWAPGAYCL